MRALRLISCLMAVVLLAAGPAFGDAFEWTGAAGNDLWGDGGNWNRTSGTSGRTFPNDTGDSATITSFGSDRVVDVSSSFSVGALTAGNTSYKLTLGGSGDLTTSGADWNSQGVVQFDIDVGMGNFKDLQGTSGAMTIIGSGSTFTSSRQPRLRHPFRIFGRFNVGADVLQVRDRLEVATDGDMTNTNLGLHGGGGWELAAFGSDRSVNAGIDRTGNRSGKFDGTNGNDLAFNGSHTLGAIGAITDGTPSLEIDTSKLTLEGNMALVENDGFVLHPVRVLNGGTLELKATCGTSGVDFVVDGEGRLLLNNTAGSATGTGNTLVVGRQNWVGSTGVTLGGIGSTDSDLVIGAGGTLAPGNSTGTLGGESVTFEAGSTYEWEFGEGASDLLAVDGDITIEDDNDFTIDITDLRGGPFGTLDLMTYGGTLNGDPDLWTINLPPRVTFNELNDTGDAIQITGLTPEPSAALLLIMAGLTLLTGRRRS